MHINDFIYKLPPSNIALHPVSTRGNSRLLVLDKDTGNIHHDMYNKLYNYISPGDVVVLNDTKVIKARLLVKSGSRTRELLLIERHSKTIDHHNWIVLCRGKIKAGEEYTVGNAIISIDEVLGNGLVKISCSKDILKLCSIYGNVPLPPYLHRSMTEQDVVRYQTEFAKTQGSVAAPTASLNFTNELIRKIEAKGAVVKFITLHVGLGTFLPIRTEVLEEHKMHSEYFEVPKKTIDAIAKGKHSGNKIIAVGTTVTRTLEYLYQHNNSLNTKKDLTGEADIFIYPGYKFKVVDAMLTNFHAPRSTVLMMASAFAGWNNISNAYKVALDNDYQFLSYGDSMLIP